MARPLGRYGVVLLACAASALAWSLLGVPDRGTAAPARAQLSESEGASSSDAQREARAVDDSGLSAIDPLVRARAVAALGDARVLAQLAPRPEGGPVDPALALAAARSAPWLADPTLALGPLIALMAGRDPDLAPAAAQAVVEIARAFAERSRLPESLTSDQLAELIKQLGAIDRNPRARADIRLAAVQAAALLTAAGERLPPPPA